MKLNENFNQQEFIDWISGFLPDFSKDIRKVDVSKSFQGIKSIQTIGESPLGVRVYIIETEQDPSRRKIGLATESFTLLRDYGTPNAIIVYYSENSSLWRLSLLTSTLTWDEGKIKKKLSNPKRQSYVLGSKAKVKTPHQYLISKGSVTDFTDLKSRFSLEVVNKEFYKEISSAFIHLVGGQIANGKSKKTVEAQLKLPFVKDHSQTSQEFAVRLIGRIIFCWFLREKRIASGHSLMPRELLSFEASSTIEDYYHKILEPIFFEVLNKPIKTRKDAFINDLFSAIPYLNGGLFSPHDDDFFNYNEGKQAVNHNMVVVPDKWLKSLFEVLETFNFTIDENTSFDEELSIDPEMLGRIFENLLAEINPETGESARKSTGSYYTPRVIVDYMVDESLYLFLKDKTNIPEEKLRSLISYDLEDDNSSPLNDEEKDKIAQALGSIKILDPACGSGAFPIGALQKIVFILQQIDQHGQLWFKKQIQNTPIELRKVIEREFQEKNFDYIRKLGIIRENIYGIDIQPIATEISRLRCFLTLVVDERIDDTLENRGIEPLPNLDFKFVTANTLVGLPTTGGTANQMGLFEDDQGIKELKEVRDMFFNASGFERDQLKLQFVQTQNRMFQKLISEGLRGHADMTAKLTTWDPFSHKSAQWFDPEWMFGLKTGFDLIIGNPPYIQFQKLKKEFREYLRTDPHYESQSDIWYFFVFKSEILLKDSGILNLIVSNYFLDSSHAKTLRLFISKHFNIESILDFRGSKVFDNASINTLVFHLKKTLTKAKKVTYINIDAAEMNSRSLNLLKNSINSNNFESEKWIIAGDEETLLLSKINEKSDKLGNLAQIGTGIKSGDDKVFVLDLNEIRANEIEKEVLRKWIKNSDINAYSIKHNNLFVIYTHKNFDINDYPNTKKYLYAHQESLKKKWKARGEETEFWRLYRAREYLFENNETPLIICPYKAPENRFSVGNNITGSGDIYVIKLFDNKYTNAVLAILNSKLGNWINKKIGKKKGNLYEYYTEPLSIFPIRKLNEMKHLDKISELVANLIEIKSNASTAEDNQNFSRVNNQIDELVFDMYELSNDEVNMIKLGVTKND